jgi:hypothetical protein
MKPAQAQAQRLRRCPARGRGFDAGVSADEATFKRFQAIPKRSISFAVSEVRTGLGVTDGFAQIVDLPRRRASAPDGRVGVWPWCSRITTAASKEKINKRQKRLPLCNYAALNIARRQRETPPIGKAAGDYTILAPAGSWTMTLMEKCGLRGTTARKIGFLTDSAFPRRRRGVHIAEGANHD